MEALQAKAAWRYRCRRLQQEAMKTAPKTMFEKNTLKQFPTNPNKEIPYSQSSFGDSGKG